VIRINKGAKMGYSSSILIYIHLIEAASLSLSFGLLSNYLFFKLIDKYRNPSITSPLAVIFSALKRALYFIFPLLYFIFFSEFFNFYEASDYTEIIVKITACITFTLISIKFLDYMDIWLEHKKNSVTDTSHISMLITRVYLIKKILKSLLILLGVALILLNFPDLKEFGKGMLISAGVAGGILAFASNKIFSNLFSGIEVIFNKPLQIGDLIKVKDELGNIEKITLNQIHLRTWDLRLIIFPLTYFIENSFQNLSHVEKGLKGTVFFYLDYNLNLENLRKVQTSILSKSPLWDKKTNILQITDLNSHVQLRSLISANNAGDLWNLQCYLREEMISYIQKNNGEILPKERIQYISINTAEKIS